MPISKPVEYPSKFTPEEIAAKALIKLFRTERGLNMVDGAALLGVTRKQLEDIETTRNYGCHIMLHTLVRVCRGYNLPVNVFEKVVRNGNT